MASAERSVIDSLFGRVACCLRSWRSVLARIIRVNVVGIIVLIGVSVFFSGGLDLFAQIGFSGNRLRSMLLGLLRGLLVVVFGSLAGLPFSIFLYGVLGGEEDGEVVKDLKQSVFSSIGFSLPFYFFSLSGASRRVYPFFSVSYLLFMGSFVGLVVAIAGTVTCAFMRLFRRGGG